MPSLPPYVLRLECIGDDQAAFLRQASHALAGLAGPAMARLFTTPSRRPWVAELTGHCPTYGFTRLFLESKKDYSEANSLGSRGVYATFLLEEGPLYDVCALLSWKRTERYYCQVRLGAPWRLTKQEVTTCLSAVSASTF